MANQFTKGTRKRHDEATKDRIRAESLARRLYKFAKAKGEKAEKEAMSQAQVAAAKVLIERGKPALQSIEAVHREEVQTPEEIEAQMRALLADPGFRAQLKAQLEGQPVQVEDEKAA